MKWFPSLQSDSSDSADLVVTWSAKQLDRSLQFFHGMLLFEYKSTEMRLFMLYVELRIGDFYGCGFE